MQIYANANHSFDGKSGNANATQADKDADILAKTRTLNFLKPFLGL
jgi:dienelactone hydrolase